MVLPMGKPPFSLVWRGGEGGGGLTIFLAIIAFSKFPWIHKNRLLPITGIVVSPVVYQEDNVGQLRGHFRGSFTIGSFVIQ